MSLASFLLGGLQTSTSESAQVDGELDALFRSNPRPPATSQSKETSNLSIPNVPSPKSSHAKGSKRKREKQASREHPGDSTNVVELNVPIRRKTKRQRLATVADVGEGGASEHEVENDASLEDNYLSRGTTQKVVPTPVTDDVTGAEASEVDPKSNPLPVHETQAKSGGRKSRSKPLKRVKYIPPDETPAQRDARTIFVGNIPISVVKSKSLQKQLKRHLVTLVTGSKIESVRFRSVAFASATTPLPKEDTKTSSNKKTDSLSTKQQRQHDRATHWRESEGSSNKVPGKNSRDDDETSEREDSQSNAKKASYLTPAERKRVAFIKGEFHKEVDTVNAYIVFAHTEPSDDHEAMAGQSSKLHPFEAARLAVEQCDGTQLMDRTIRVDRVGQWRVGVGAFSSVGGDDVGMSGDPRTTLFVGNLDFAAKEEDLRVWFEGVVSQERGPPPPSDEGGSTEGHDSSEEDVDSEKKAKERRRRWVRSVRIVRDRDTQLGKGFAYVRFSDRECVDEILGLESSKLKFAKRKLRVQRCKVFPGLPTAKQHKAKSAISPRVKKAAAAVTTSTAPLPKGDPSFGEKLIGLSKDERKAAKAANADRVKRRLAKKKAKEGVEKAQSGKDRKRERSRLQNKNGGKAKVVNKGRVRSDKSLAKKNTKK